LQDFKSTSLHLRTCTEQPTNHRKRHKFQYYVAPLAFLYIPHVHLIVVKSSINQINQSINLADTAGNSGAGSPPAGAVDSAGAKTTLGESRPDLASVGTAGKGTVSVEDGIAGLDEVGVAGLAVWKLAVYSVVKMGD
jgi:hypothetical protein